MLAIVNNYAKPSEDSDDIFTYPMRGTRGFRIRT